MTVSPADSLRLDLLVPSEARAGATIPITLRMTNVSQRPLDLYLRGRTIAFDIVVAAEDGRVVWSRLEREIIPAIVQIKTLAPGETSELRAEWAQHTNDNKPVAPGRYTLTGLLLTDGPEPLRTPPAPLRIVAR